MCYIGGFLNGRRAAEGVGYALEKHFEEVDAFTFSDAMKDQKNTFKAASGAVVLTHSAAMLAIVGSKPAELHAIAAPIPTPRT